MADIAYDEQGTPTAPTGVVNILYPDSSSHQWTHRDATGRCSSLGSAIRNWNIVDAVANAADTYLFGSALAVPQHLLQAGTTFRWRMVATKTAAGVATPIWTIRIGTGGTVADAARVVLTGPAQTAVVDTAIIDIVAILRNTGAAGILTASLALQHNLAATGFATIANPVLAGTSAGFDTTVANLKVGISVNPGAAGVWTHTIVAGEMLNV